MVNTAEILEFNRRSSSDSSDNSKIDQLLDYLRNNSQIARILEIVSEIFYGSNDSGTKSLYDMLRKPERRSVERFDVTAQKIDNLKAPGVELLKNYLDETLRGKTLEGYLRNETNVNDGINSLREIIDKSQNRLHNNQLELLLSKLKVTDDEVAGKGIAELDVIILNEQSNLESEAKELSMQNVNKDYPVDKSQVTGDENGFLHDDTIQVSNLFFIKSVEISSYLNLRELYGRLNKNSNRVLNGLESLTKQSTWNKISRLGLQVWDTALEYVNPISVAEKIKMSKSVIGYGPTVLGVAALAAGGFALYQFVNLQVDTNVLGDVDAAQTQISGLQMQLESLTERYTNVLEVKERAYSAFQTAGDKLASLRDFIREYSIVQKGQSIWSMVQGFLTEFNPNRVISNQNIADAVARVCSASDMMTPAELVERFPNNAYPHGNYLADIPGNCNLVYKGDEIKMEVLTNIQSHQYQVESLERAYKSSTQTVGIFESQLADLNKEISAQSSGIIERINHVRNYALSFFNPLKDVFTVAAGVISPILLGLSVTMSYHKENGLLHNLFTKSRAYNA